MSVANEFINLAAGTYCARVHARTDRDTANHDVYGDWTYLDDGTGRGTAFEFTGYPPTQSAGCLGYPCTDDYLTPVRGTNLTQHAVLHLEPDRRHPELLRDRLEGRELHLDRRLRLHARARLRAAHGVATRAYTDESTSYYWAVLPSPNYDGNNAVGNPLLAHAGDFQKQSVPPSLLYPAAGRSSPTSRPSAGRPATARAATGSRSPATRPSATCSTTSSSTRPRTRATRPTRPTPSSTGACAPTTRT